MNNKKILIGIIEDFPEYISEDKTVGILNIKKKYSVEIYVNPTEGPICHFHVSKKDNSFNTCVCIYEPCYFMHGNYIDKFNQDQKNKLDYFMRQPSIDDPSETNWQKTVRLWKENNPDNYNRYSYEKQIAMKYRKGPVQPDYTKMTKTIQNL